MDPSSPTLILDHVSKSFGDFKAVSDLSLQVRPGRVFGLIGPNGAGKTTTIRMIVNITAPDTGTIKLFGKSMTTALQDRIGYLPEERGLYRKMKVGEQLRFFAELKGLPSREADKRLGMGERVENVLALIVQSGSADLDKSHVIGASIKDQLLQPAGIQRLVL